jgi:hypothetical protein
MVSKQAGIALVATGNATSKNTLISQQMTMQLQWVTI